MGIVSLGPCLNLVNCPALGGCPGCLPSNPIPAIPTVRPPTPPEPRVRLDGDPNGFPKSGFGIPPWAPLLCRLLVLVELVGEPG